MIYYVNFSTHGIAHFALMSLDYSDPQKPVGTILALYDEFNPTEDLNTKIKEVKLNNTVHNYTIHIADVIQHSENALEELEPMDIALAVAKVFTPDLLFPVKPSLLQTIFKS